MDEPSSHLSSPVSRRTAIAGIGAGAASLALGAKTRLAFGQDTELLAEDDIVYGTVAGVDLLANVLRPATLPGPSPAVIVVHGGGLVQGSRWDHGEAATALAGAGYATFSIEYRLYVQGDDTTLWPAQLDDVQRAVRWVRANAATYNVDPERVGVFGFSSGGQLAAFLGTRETNDDSDPDLAGISSKVNAVVTLGGLFDFTFPEAHLDGAQIDAEILGGSLEALPEAAAFADYSPITFVDGTSAPFLILQEGQEYPVPYEHPRRMVAALQDAGVQVSYGWFPEYEHGTWFSWAPEAPETLAFFARHLQSES